MILSIILFFIAFVAIAGALSNSSRQKQVGDAVKVISPKQFKISIIIGVICALFGFIALPSSDKEQAKVAEEFSPEKLKVSASLTSREFVKERLKSPASADFPTTDGSDVMYLKDSLFVVKSYVDSQNSFGALLRTNYVAKMKYTGNDMWSLVDINLMER